MLLLVLADNYLLLYVGWEGVGLASYLLIGFWNHKPSAAAAAKKAFVVNRVGDFGLSLAIMLMFATFGTVDVRRRLRERRRRPTEGTLTCDRPAAAARRPAASPRSSRCSPGCGDAMEGPTPVSALIHAATMVTAGVYLIVRSQRRSSTRAPTAQPGRSSSSARSRCSSGRSSAAPRTTSRRRWPARR